jgi:hypothetical protein
MIKKAAFLQNGIPASILLVLIIFLANCSTVTPSQFSQPPSAYQTKNAKGDMVWRKNAIVLIGGANVNTMVESINLTRLLQPGNSVDSIPINIVPYETSSFGQWHTTDGSKFQMTSEVQFDKARGVFLLISPVFNSMSGKNEIQLAAIGNNGKQVSVNIPGGKSIKNHERINIDGSIKKLPGE